MKGDWAVDIYAKLQSAGIRVNDMGQIHKEDVEKAMALLKPHFVAGNPQLISGTDFPLRAILENEVANVEMYEKLMSSSKKKKMFDIPPNGEVYSLGQKIFLANNDKKRVDYFVQYEKQRFKGILTITQIAIWLQYSSKYVNMPNGERVSTYLFFNHLLPMAEAVMTDSLQTPDGRRFWVNRTADAIKQGLYVYTVWRDKNEIIQIKTMDDLSMMP